MNLNQTENNIVLTELLSHMNWADSIVWQSVFSTPLTENDQKIRKLLFHVHLVQRAFLGLWTRQKPVIPDPANFPDLLSICKWGCEYHKKANLYFSTIEEESLNLPLDVPWSKRIEAMIGKPVVPITIGQSMLQVTSHSTYHRAQINSRLRELGGEPPMVDFIAWIWLGKPDAKWLEL